ncbi:MarR family winged helix-turn-helix transcriptional regulator [Sporomusa sphaeroides]|uniref:MarR family winged helix-turn-helix transcriptional regulator n=1 Tax=Sporomusa sphaeroides TaxID=47679 RepID=UPI0018E9C7D7|nr:MarR family transcriptional regulator [Sporomusa sphaeroides]
MSLGRLTEITHNDISDSYFSIRTLIELTVFQDNLDDVLEMHFSRYGLSRAKFSALIQLYMTGGGGLTQSELGKKLLVSRANITRLIDRLEKEDLVVRKTDPVDKRAFQLYLTDRANILMHAFVPVHNQYVHKLMSTLDTDEKKLLISLLDKLKKGLEEV